MMSTTAIDICIIEDDAIERELLQRRYLRMGYRVVQACDGEEGLALIRRHRPHVVISDVMLPNMNGIDVCRAVRADAELAGTYLILITAYDSQKRKRDALNAGADDYLIKPYDAAELEAKTRNGLRISRLQEDLRTAALTDGLTELWNHAQFRQRLDGEFARARRYGGDVALLMIDIDHFKAVNDAYGHEVGNDVLRKTARHLQDSVRDVDVVARYGGEEFAVICPQTHLLAAAQLAERIRKTLPHRVRLAEHPNLTIQCSIGVANAGDPRVKSAVDLVSVADEALYHAKMHGRNRISCCDQLDEDDTPTIQLGEVERLRKEVVTLSLQAKELCLQSVWALVQALEARDPFTAQHSRNVRFYVQQLVEQAGWPENLRVVTCNAAMLHDLGKIGIPDAILQKPERLTAEEAAALKQVPMMTCKILEPLKVFETETTIIRYLRERYDGTGYPDGLSGDTIPIGSRMLAIAETFDALTSNRAYRSGRPIEDAVKIIRGEAGKHFDPQFTELLVQVVEQQRDAWQAQVNDTSTELFDRESLLLEHA
jgi:diguanylate cyclase (GGDEF)-like protein